MKPQTPELAARARFMAEPQPETTLTLPNAEQSLRKHLTSLGLDVDQLKAHLPEDLALSLNDGVLSLGQANNTKLSLVVDFTQGALAHRGGQHLGSEHLVKACRIKNQTQVQVLDATCGMGKDSFLLHQAGFSVTAIEQHPVTHALLRDGLQRWQAHNGSRVFELLAGDAKKLMQTMICDVIYLDPMFPEKQKTAKSKKDMQLFQSLHLPIDDQAEELLRVALTSECQRVVIKRPAKSPLLLNRKPTFQVIGKTCRFDVFQCS